MTEDLIIKEKGFRKLNKELEQKAHDLMKKIDCVINTYNNGCLTCNTKEYHTNCMKEKAEYSRSITMHNGDNSQVSVKRNSSLPHVFNQTTLTLKSDVESQKSDEDDIFKQRNLANKTVVNLFKVKVDILQNELHAMQMEYKKKCDICKNLESETKRTEIKLQTEIESLKETIIKLENSNKELQCQSHALNIENSSLRKDLDKLQKQIKITNQQYNNCIMRLNRSLESNDKLKSVIKYSEIEEKELKTQIRKLQEDRRVTVNNLGKQLSELVQVFRKQMLIIDNLKKQNACLVAVGQLKLTKEDFSRLLDQKPENL
ncbi:Testis-expressed sequence 9 protein [Habropoda laboriosa]|uniref:Testis-expressed sequence 9 protein n=1 Tax=Habropoda laboriosa TaxID=597456 RepID=A0A0L7RD17_9HYME|nr:PREDICTED: spindle assembly checkpoint component MAD1 [Habropoda laboriosa]KOC68753.1 Testis-expressed sequence 9 protein [Habropoda laboriosa]